MKRKLISFLMVLAMGVTLLSGCSHQKEETESDQTVKGSVYLLNFKPESDSAWHKLADIYTEETGVPVKVMTGAKGHYNTTLQEEMEKSKAPTIFNVGNVISAQMWNDYILDLSDSAIYDHLTDKSLTIKYDGKIAGVASCYECYGLIYNKTILEGYCKMDGAVVSSVDEINSFEKLEAVADDINTRIDEVNVALGTNLAGAFTSAGLDNGSSWRFSGHLVNLPLYYEFKDAGCDLLTGTASLKGTYLKQYKAVWDMYVRDSAADPKELNSGTLNAEAEFGMERAVFFQNGDWEYTGLTNVANGYRVRAEDLSMMPIYFGVDDENQGLCVGTENYWAVNQKASADDIQASLDFLEWVITSDVGRNYITNVMGWTAPFDTFTGEYETRNAFAQAANALIAQGKTSVAWSFNATPNVDDWRAEFVKPLIAYTAGEGSWNDVEKAFIDGWAKQWGLVHKK